MRALPGRAPSRPPRGPRQSGLMCRISPNQFDWNRKPMICRESANRRGAGNAKFLRDCAPRELLRGVGLLERMRERKGVEAGAGVENPFCGGVAGRIEAAQHL